VYLTTRPQESFELPHHVLKIVHVVGIYLFLMYKKYYRMPMQELYIFIPYDRLHFCQIRVILVSDNLAVLMLT
jgi:hypothetical protein